MGTVAPSGGKWWRLKFRVGGKEKRLSLGTYTDTSLKEARERRDAARKQLAAGEDPSAARRADKAAKRAEALNNFEAFALAWLDHRGGAWAERTRAARTALLENAQRLHAENNRIAMDCAFTYGRPCWDRTNDQRIMSPLL